MYQKSESRQITVAEMAPHVHSFKANENKVNKISKWLIEWIENSMRSGSIKPYDMLPSKGDLAFHIGVSQGTMQNVFRYVEDCGLIESKQRIGTFIRNPDEKCELSKLTSKREIAIESIKQYIITQGFQPGSCLTSTRKLAELIGVSNATVRLAFGTLVSEGILKKVNNAFVIMNIDFSIESIQTQTLVEKTAEHIKKYIESNFKKGDKLPTNIEFAKMFDVSVKTVHDSIKLLSRDGILYSRRGQYGTVLVSSENPSSLYYYEQIEMKIRNLIVQNYEVGARLPSILALSKQYSVSAKTIKKALNNLTEDGYIMFSRGRYGGTFVTDIPQRVNEAYKWLVLNPDYVSNT